MAFNLVRTYDHREGLPKISLQNRSFRKSLMIGSAIIVSALVLGGCAKRDGTTTGSINRGQSNIDQMSGAQLKSAVNQLGQRYQKNPSDKNIAISYATALRTDGRNDQALAVMRKLAIDLPNDRDVLAAYGKALASAGEFETALDSIRRAQSPEYPDWKLLSAEGAILDQLGQPEAARQTYRRALDIVPNEPSVLSNLGMSYLLTGDLRTAETMLRSALDQPGADARVRQNLAMVIGLQGRFDEAENIARQTLSPAEAEANVAYLQSILKQQNAWADIEKEGKKPKS